MKLIKPITSSGNWHAKLFRKVHFDFHVSPYVTGVGSKFNPEEFQRFLKESDVQAILIFGKDHNGQLYHSSKIGHTHPHLACDLFGKMGKAAKELGLKVLCYYSIGVDTWIVNENPSWAFQPFKGPLNRMLQIYKPVCYNSPYGKEVLKPHLLEITGNYEIDGFWYDASAWCFEEPCKCEFCRESFSKETGLGFPVSLEDAGYPVLKKWYFQKIQDFLQYSVDVPLEIDRNYLVSHNWMSSYREPALPAANVGFLSGDISFAYPLLEASFAGRSFAPQELSFDIMTPRMQNSWLDETLKPVASLKQESSLILATGATTFLGEKPYPDGRLDPEVWKTVKEVNRFVKSREKYCRGQKAFSDIAILHSAKNMLENSYRLFDNVYLDKLKGAHKIITGGGLHCLIYDETRLVENLGDFKLIVIPDQKIMEPETYNAIVRFVKEGGTVLSAGKSFLSMRNDDKNLECPVSDLVGFREAGDIDYPYGYISDAGFSTLPIFVDEKFRKVELTTGRPLAAICKSDIPVDEEHRFFYIWKSPPEKETGFPAAVLNEVGKGRVISVTADVFTACWKENNPAVKNYVIYLIDKYAGDPVIKVSDPGVEIMLFKIKDGYRVHLVNTYGNNRICPGNQVVEKIPPVRNITIRFSGIKTPRQIRLVTGKQRLKLIGRNRGSFKVLIPDIELYEILELLY